jgi:hypothetical protein
VWHRECLNCQFCRVNVADQLFANVSQKPCCRTCYQQRQTERRGQRQDPGIVRSASASE